MRPDNPESLCLKQTRGAIKCLGFGLIVIAYFVTVSPFYLVYLFKPFETRKWLVQAVSFYSQLTLKWLGIKVVFDSDIADVKNHNENYLIVANHLSYIDVLVLAALIPSCFITSVEIKQTPFLGQICMLGGCLFVERRSRKSLSDEISDVTEALKSGLNVVLFPEATSGNGEQLLRFRKPLYRAAIDAQKPMLPMSLNYLRIDGARVDLSNRDKVCWYGEMGFFGHFIEVCKCREIKVLLSKTPMVSAVDKDESELAELSYLAINQQYVPLGVCEMIEA